MQWWGAGAKLYSLVIREPARCLEFGEDLDKMEKKNNLDKYYVLWGKKPQTIIGISFGFHFILSIHLFNLNRKETRLVLLIWIEMKDQKNEDVYQEALNASIF